MLETNYFATTATCSAKVDNLRAFNPAPPAIINWNKPTCMYIRSYV